MSYWVKNVCSSSLYLIFDINHDLDCCNWYFIHEKVNEKLKSASWNVKNPPFLWPWWVGHVICDMWQRSVKIALLRSQQLYSTAFTWVDTKNWVNKIGFFVGSLLLLLSPPTSAEYWHWRQFQQKNRILFRNELISNSQHFNF